MNRKPVGPAALWLEEEWRAVEVRASARSFNEVTGTSGDDLIVLRKVSSGVSGSVTWGPDRIAAGLGSDRVDASRGNDLVYGEVGAGGSSLAAGDDRIKGGPGDDLLYGEGPSGSAYTRFGADRIDGGTAPTRFSVTPTNSRAAFGRATIASTGRPGTTSCAATARCSPTSQPRVPTGSTVGPATIS